MNDLKLTRPGLVLEKDSPSRKSLAQKLARKRPVLKGSVKIHGLHPEMSPGLSPRGHPWLKGWSGLPWPLKKSLYFQLNGGEKLG